MFSRGRVLVETDRKAMGAVNGVVKDREETYSLEQVNKAIMRKNKKKTSSYCYLCSISWLCIL